MSVSVRSSILSFVFAFAACGEDATRGASEDGRDASDAEVLIDPGFRDTWSPNDGATGDTFVDATAGDTFVDATAGDTLVDATAGDTLVDATAGDTLADSTPPGDTIDPGDTSAPADLLTPETSPRPCDLPWGGSVAHGLSVTAYPAARVGCRGACEGELRVCNDGVLSGTATAQSCFVEACRTCALPWGGSVAHGDSVTAYASGAASCGKSCQPEVRTCDDGALSGSFTAQACSVSPCAACTLPWGGSVAHGQSVTAYASATVACGGTCTSETRVCGDGTLSGAFTAQTCSVSACAPEIIFSTSFGGAPMTSFRMDRTFYGRMRNLTATNTESCAEPAGIPAPNCRNGAPWTRLPNSDWSYDTTTSEWRAVFPPNSFPPGTFEVFVRNTDTRQQTNMLVTITNPCYWTAVVAGPVSPPTSPACTAANAGATTDYSGYTWTCVCN